VTLNKSVYTVRSLPAPLLPTVTIAYIQNAPRYPASPEALFLEGAS